MTTSAAELDVVPDSRNRMARSYSEEILRLVSQTLAENRVAVFIVAYNAEKHIETVLDRIPDWVAKELAEVFIIDDSSKDTTIQKAVSMKWTNVNAPLRVFRTPYNQGYGGNQRLGYSYAIAQKFDIVVLLHGDGQYAPEFLPEILAEYSRPPGADAVFGSRFMTKWGALKGGMPFYKFLGNRILTWIQNKLIGTRMSEMHSGYRSYRTSALKKIPFQANSLGFDFDSDIIIQFAAAGLTIREVPIPTFYGDEICNVNGFKYAWACLKTSWQHRLMQLEIFYDPKFDFPNQRQRKYTIKAAPTSLHYHIRQLSLPLGSELLDLGGSDGSAVGLAHADRGVNTTVIDLHVTVDNAEGWRAVNHPHLRQVAVDLDGDWTAAVDTSRFETVFALDVLEHMKSPERTVEQIFSVMTSGGKLYASTGNVSYWIIRGIHILGHFNYGRRGILDLTHTRLFTVRSFRRLLRNAGFRIDKVSGFGPPIADLAGGKTGTLLMIDQVSAWLVRNWEGLFGYQILIEATRPDSVETLMAQTFLDHRESGAADLKRFPVSRTGTSQ
jgi:glycosyltransferase involved in cell wall biosynthesis